MCRGPHLCISWGLGSVDDKLIWDFAARYGYTIVSKDVDFQDQVFLLEHRQKVIWHRTGNCSKSEIERVIRQRLSELLSFDADPTRTACFSA